MTTFLRAIGERLVLEYSKGAAAITASPCAAVEAFTRLRCHVAALAEYLDLPLVHDDFDGDTPLPDTPAPLPGDLVSLAGFVRTTGAITIASLTRARQRDPAFPRPCGRTGASQYPLYKIADLAAWLDARLHPPTPAIPDDVDPDELIDSRAVAKIIGLGDPDRVSLYSRRYADWPPLAGTRDGRNYWRAGAIWAWHLTPGRHPRKAGV